MDYGQFCPIAKAAEVLGEKWTILILRQYATWGVRRARGDKLGREWMLFVPSNNGRL